jgi:hypothetical protein
VSTACSVDGTMQLSDVATGHQITEPLTDHIGPADSSGPEPDH